MTSLQGIEGMRESWRQRAEAKRVKDEAEAERRAEQDAIWGKQARDWQAKTDAMFGRGPKPTEEELKARQAAYNAEAPARLEAQRERERFRRHVAELVALADREVERLASKAHRDGLCADEIDAYTSAHARAAAMQSLVNRLGRADEQAAVARRHSIVGHPGMARV